MHPVHASGSSSPEAGILMRNGRRDRVMESTYLICPLFISCTLLVPLMLLDVWLYDRHCLLVFAPSGSESRKYRFLCTRQFLPFGTHQLCKLTCARGRAHQTTPEREMWRSGTRTELGVGVLLFKSASPFHGEKHVRRARFLRHTLVFFAPRLPLLRLRTICTRCPANPTAREM